MNRSNDDCREVSRSICSLRCTNMAAMSILFIRSVDDGCFKGSFVFNFGGVALATVANEDCDCAGWHSVAVVDG